MEGSTQAGFQGTCGSPRVLRFAWPHSSPANFRCRSSHRLTVRCPELTGRGGSGMERRREMRDDALKVGESVPSPHLLFSVEVSRTPPGR